GGEGHGPCARFALAPACPGAQGGAKPDDRQLVAGRPSPEPEAGRPWPEPDARARTGRPSPEPAPVPEPEPEPVPEPPPEPVPDRGARRLTCAAHARMLHTRRR